MSDERNCLICSTVDGHDTPIEGSTRGHYCEVCAAELWRAPSSDHLVDVMTVCAPCAVGLMETEADPIIMPVTEAQRAELREHRRKAGP